MGPFRRAVPLNRKQARLARDGRAVRRPGRSAPFRAHPLGFLWLVLAVLAVLEAVK